MGADRRVCGVSGVGECGVFGGEGGGGVGGGEGGGGLEVEWEGLDGSCWVRVFEVGVGGEGVFEGGRGAEGKEGGFG